ncbi:MFS transporter [Enterococcus raffinosus]|uniref:MFS transporter n=1 Tax=Enterococcus raffinosus TaxID=71452 RepID=UPI001C101AAE|nr:MFS transporter [Enterococcus raffinosus]MBU5362565.1 MFS transporter [Enterococcus raffinosus]
MNRMTKMALLSVSLLVVSAGAIAGNIPAIATAYPDINETIIELLTTLPSLFIILTVLISPKIAKKIGYKKTVQIGIVLVLGAGILPVITKSFAVLFLSRVLFGIGVGLLNPLLYSFASHLYHGGELASVIGLQSAFEGIGGMLITFLVGQLLVIDWRISFLVYFLALPVLLLFSFLVPDIPKIKPGAPIKKAGGKLSSSFGGYLLLLIVIVTVYMSVTVKVTSLLMDKGIGDATDGSNLIALVGLGAMLAGMFFGRTFLTFKKNTLVLAFILLAAAMFLLAFSKTLWLTALAAILCGFAFRTFIPYVFNEINQQSGNPEKNTAILLMAFNFGAALAPISIALAQRKLPFLQGAGLFIGEGILILVMAIVLGIGSKIVNRTRNLSIHRKKEMK